MLKSWRFPLKPPLPNHSALKPSEEVPCNCQKVYFTVGSMLLSQVLPFVTGNEKTTHNFVLCVCVKLFGVH